MMRRRRRLDNLLIRDVARGRKRMGGLLPFTPNLKKDQIMLLTFLVVCFAGLAFMFFCIQRAQEKLLQTMQEEHAQMRTVLRALEARLNALEPADVRAGDKPQAAPRMTLDRDMTERPVDEGPLHLQGATVAEAAEMLRSGTPLLDMDLQMDEPAPRRGSRKDGTGMPDLKL